MDGSSAIPLRLARLRAAAFGGVDLLLNRQSDPGQGRGQQEITDRDKYGQHRPLPQCTTCAYVRCSRPSDKRDALTFALNCEAGVTRRFLPLDRPGASANWGAMLQHNSVAAGRRAHLAHAAVVSLHALCCGLPALALLAAAASGAATSIVLLSDFVTYFHAVLHRHEIWVLAFSALFVAVGGALEIWGRLRPHQLGFPWLFALSAACFVLNFVIVISHRAAG